MDNIDVKGSRILIVDDDPLVGELLGRSLSGNYEIRTAENGDAALSEASRWRPDLLLLDLVMPGMGGLEVCRRLKADPATRHIPVLFLTSVTDTERKVEGFSAGGVDYITKPFIAAEVEAG